MLKYEIECVCVCVCPESRVNVFLTMCYGQKILHLTFDLLLSFNSNKLFQDFSDK